MLTKYFSLWPLVVIASAALSPPRDEQSGNQEIGFKLDFKILYRDPHGNDSSFNSSGLAKRADGKFKLGLVNRNYYYSTELFVGSNGDKCKVSVDTGSTDTWVVDQHATCEILPEPNSRQKRDTPKSRLTKRRWTHFTEKKARSIYPKYWKSTNSHEEDCKDLGVFRKKHSSTFKKLSHNPEFSVSYTDGTAAVGIWGTDMIGTSKFQVKMPFGVADTTSGKKGVLGLGHPKDTGMEVPKGYTYLNFSAALKEAGHIKKMAFSVYLKGQNANKGSILFGAVDHKKYSGQLYTVPMVNTYKHGKIHSYTIILEKLVLILPDRTENILLERIGATLDSGNSHSAFPKNIFLALVKQMGAKYSSESNRYKLDCLFMKKPGYIVYFFSGKPIVIPMRDFVSEEDGTCYLAAKVSEDDDFLASAYLGDSFLRSAYVVYDLENMEISLAQVAHSKKSEVEAIKSTIPRASKAIRYWSTSIVESVSASTVTN